MKRTERIASLNQQITELKERTRAAEKILRNRRQRLENAERTKERKRDTRRKVLTGAAIITAAKTDPQLNKLLDQARDRYLTKSHDRALFGLPPLAAPGPSPPSAPTGEQDAPRPDWRPAKLPDGSWGTRFDGDTSILPAALVGQRITVQARNGETWTATITEVRKRSAHHVLVRDSGKPAKVN